MEKTDPRLELVAVTLHRIRLLELTYRLGGDHKCERGAVAVGHGEPYGDAVDEQRRQVLVMA